MTHSFLNSQIASLRSVFATALLLLALPSVAPSQTITLIAPRAGDSVIRGGTYSVRWDHSPDLSGTVTISLTHASPSGGGSILEWTHAVPIADKSFTWDVLEEASAGYVLEIVHTSAFATSGPFTVSTWTFSYDRDSTYTVPSVGTLFDNAVTLAPTCSVSSDLGVGLHGRQVQYFGYGDITGRIGITHWLDGITQYDDGAGGTYFGGDGIAVTTSSPMIDVTKDLVVRFRARKAADLGTKQGNDIIFFFVASPTPSPVRANPVGILHYPQDFFAVNLRGGPINYLKVSAVTDGLQSGNGTYDGVESLNTTAWHDYRVEIAAGSTAPRLYVDGVLITPPTGPEWTIRPLSQWDGVNVYFACASITYAGVTNFLYMKELSVANDSVAVVVGVEHPTGTNEGGIRLWQSAPNPARGMATIRFALPESARGRMAVHDVQGRMVAVLVDGAMAAGEHVVQMDSSRLAPGVYLCRLEAGDAIATSRLVIMK